MTGDTIMKIDVNNNLVRILALLGLVLAIKLAFIFYNANYNEYSLSSFCSINNFIDCDGVAKTKYSQFLGIPLAYWGIFLYITILFLSVVKYLQKIKFLKFLEVFKSPNDYVIFLGVMSFFFSMVLAGISFGIIKKLCILCLITYVIDLIISLIASHLNLKNILKAFKTTFFDFIDGVKQYKKTFITLLLIVSAFLAYSGITLNFVPHAKRIRSLQKYLKIKYNPYRVSGNTLGNPNGNVVIEVYSDFVCPMCYMNNIMLHQAVKEYGNIHVIHHNLPFDKECNPYMSINMHPSACFMSRGAIAAKNQGNYWEMSSLLYENKPSNIESMMKLANQLGFDSKKFLEDIKSPETRNSLFKEIQSAQDLGINATPTMIVNGDKITGIRPYYQLKNILEEHGAAKAK